jgi:ADP-ribosylglycohydrolase
MIDYRETGRLKKDTEQVSLITHNNPEAIAGAQAVAYAITKCLTGNLEVEELIDQTRGYIGKSDVARRLEQTQKLLDAKFSPEDALRQIGTGGSAPETVSSAFYAFLRTPENVHEALTTIVMAGGDTDTAGAIVGAISGAHNGIAGIPKLLVDGVENREKIERLAAGIYELVGDKD